MSRCMAVAVVINGAGETIKAQVAPGFGSDEDVAALADLIAAARRKMAAVSHPDHTMARCPRCEAAAGRQCSTRGGRPVPWGHLERHAAAIETDGRTCADGGAS